MQKTEQKTEQQAGLGMSFCEEEGRITVFRKTLEALEWPSHYRFLYNRKMKQIAVQACGAEESGAHRVGKPDESNSGEIKCMALVRMIYGDSGWDKKMSYRLLGRAFPQQRLVSFKITDAMQIENGRVLTENVNLTSAGSRIISCPRSNSGEECDNMDNSTQEKFTVSRLMRAVNYGKMEAQ